MGDVAEGSNPWGALRRPAAGNPVSGVRVEAEHPWNVYWALDSDGRQVLALKHSTPVPTSLRLPRAKGLLVEHEQLAEPNGALLLLVLTEPTLRDIFWRLCTDVVESTRSSRTEGEAVATFIQRTWRWHHLLRGGGDTRLSREQQMGLLGELAVLERMLLPNLAASIAVDGWQGPAGMPKDFEVGLVGIESKAQGPSGREEVKISSIDQLARAGLDVLYLCVTGVAASPDAQTGTTVAEAAESLRSKLGVVDPSAAATFDAKLSAYGFEWSDDYSDARWIVGETSIYEVGEDFPRIEPSALPPSIIRMKYVIRLSECDAFLVGADHLRSSIGAGVTLDRE